MALTDKINDGFVALTNLIKSNKAAIADNAALLPLKVGSTWYKTGLYYDYNYPFSTGVVATTTPTANTLYAVPYRILENTTLKNIYINCTTAQAGSNCTLAIYSSNVDNTINNLLVSGTVDTSSTGVKTVSVNLELTKGQVIWFVSLAQSTGAIATVTSITASNNSRAFSGASSVNFTTTAIFTKAGVLSMPSVLSTTDLVATTGSIPRIVFSV